VDDDVVFECSPERRDRLVVVMGVDRDLFDEPVEHRQRPVVTP
jgi:hypothetical protein